MAQRLNNIDLLNKTMLSGLELGVSEWDFLNKWPMPKQKSGICLSVMIEYLTRISHDY